MVPEIVIEIQEKYGYEIDDIMEYYNAAVDLNPSIGVEEFLRRFFADKVLQEVLDERSERYEGEVEVDAGSETDNPGDSESSGVWEQ